MERRHRKTVVRLAQSGQRLYSDTLALQTQLFQENLACKLQDLPTKNTLIFCEHKPVYTMGKNGNQANLLFNPSSVGADFHQIDRGGDVTFHGPGQLTIYPIFDLDNLEIGVADFIWKLEESVIKTIALYGLKGERIKEASGVWLDVENRPRKICAVGMRISKKITMHGIAINVNTDLKYFNFIVPCGLVDKGVTSLQNELKKEIDLPDFQQKLENILQEELEFSYCD